MGNKWVLYSGIAAVALLGGYYITRGYSPAAGSGSNSVTAGAMDSGLTGGAPRGFLMGGQAPYSSGGIGGSYDPSSQFSTTSNAPATGVDPANPSISLTDLMAFRAKSDNQIANATLGSDTVTQILNSIASIFVSQPGSNGSYADRVAGVINAPGYATSFDFAKVFNNSGNSSLLTGIDPTTGLTYGTLPTGTPLLLPFGGVPDAPTANNGLSTATASGGLVGGKPTGLPDLFNGSTTLSDPEYNTDLNIPFINVPPIIIGPAPSSGTTPAIAVPGAISSPFVPADPGIPYISPIPAAPPDTYYTPPPVDVPSLAAPTPTSNPYSVYGATYGQPVAATPDELANLFPVNSDVLPGNYVAAIQPVTPNGTTEQINQPVYYQTGTPDPGIIPAPIDANAVASGNPLYVGTSTVGYNADGTLFQFADGSTIPGPVYDPHANDRFSYDANGNPVGSDE